MTVSSPSRYSSPARQCARRGDFAEDDAAKQAAAEDIFDLAAKDSRRAYRHARTSARGATAKNSFSHYDSISITFDDALFGDESALPAAPRFLMRASRRRASRA